MTLLISKYSAQNFGMFLLMIVSSFSYSTMAGELTLDVEVGVESRWFMGSASYGQENDDISLRIQAELYKEWNKGKDSVEFIPWFIQDHRDSTKTHGDIQELAWIHVEENWELRTGIRRVFWGVTESYHLVDIINQSDLSRSLDGEDKLGQPMINISFVESWGIVDLFILPGHRKRIYPGENGRPRSALIITQKDASYESKENHRRVDAAIRWQLTLGDWEIALSHFSGTSREPSIIGINSSMELMTHYPVIDQTGLEAQYLDGDWIWKLEAITRSGQGSRYSAAVGGIEYTEIGVFNTSTDLGWIAEYNYDDRMADAPHTREQDIVLGTRLTLNDAASSQAIMAVGIDTQTDEQFWSVEASRRVFDNWLLSIDMYIFANTEEPPSREKVLAEIASNDRDNKNKLAPFARDDYIQFEIIRYF